MDTLRFRSQKEKHEPSHLDVNTGGDDEKGYALTLGHVFLVTDRVGMDALLEFVSIESFDGGTDDHRYFTASLISTVDELWNMTVAYTERNIDSAGGDSDDHLQEVSGGYGFGQGTSLEFGWRISEEGGIDSDIVGGLVRQTFGL